MGPFALNTLLNPLCTVLELVLGVAALIFENCGGFKTKFGGGGWKRPNVCSLKIEWGAPENPR